MPNQNGCVHGLTFLCPIRDDIAASADGSPVPSHDLQLRDALAHLPHDHRSPFAVAPGTHLCRLVVMDDVIYVGMPSCEEHLESKYLVFETNADADATPYLRALAATVPLQVDAIWRHCVGYPGVADPAAFAAYMVSCQIETTFFFAAVNDKSVPETLAALQTQRAAADFIAAHQGMTPGQIQRDFLQLIARLNATPPPPPGSGAPRRGLEFGGKNE